LRLYREWGISTFIISNRLQLRSTIESVDGAGCGQERRQERRRQEKRRGERRRGERRRTYVRSMA
jgi:hypothetical protein